MVLVNETEKNEAKNMKENWPNTPFELTDADIQHYIEKYDTVIVDCYAPWCCPCKIVAPIIEELAKEMQGKMVFGSLNVDKNKMSCMKYHIVRIPTLLVFKNGKLVDQFFATLPKDILKQKLNT